MVPNYTLRNTTLCTGPSLARLQNKNPDQGTQHKSDSSLTKQPSQLRRRAIKLARAALRLLDVSAPGNNSFMACRGRVRWQCSLRPTRSSRKTINGYGPNPSTKYDGYHLCYGSFFSSCATVAASKFQPMEGAGSNSPCAELLIAQLLIC